VRPVESPDEALQSMAGSKRAQMLVIDARAVENVRAAVEAAEVRVPRAVILVFAEAAAEKQLAAALKGTSVFAVLPAEIEARKTQAVLEAAMAQAAQGKAGAALRAGAADVPLTIGAFRPRGASTDDEEGAQKPNLVLIGAAVAATAVVGGAFWYFMPGSGFSTRGAAPAAATHAAPPAAAAAAATDNPGGASAAAISSGHLDEAALTLASFKSAAPNDLRSGPLGQRLSSAQMSKALTDGNFERAAALLRQAQQSGSSAPDQIARWRSDLARRQEEARGQRLAGLIADRIRDGKLTDAEDSAKIYLQQLESSAPSSASTQ